MSINHYLSFDSPETKGVNIEQLSTLINNYFISPLNAKYSYNSATILREYSLELRFKLVNYDIKQHTLLWLLSLLSFSEKILKLTSMENNVITPANLQIPINAIEAVSAERKTSDATSDVVGDVLDTIEESARTITQDHIPERNYNGSSPNDEEMNSGSISNPSSQIKDELLVAFISLLNNFTNDCCTTTVSQFQTPAANKLFDNISKIFLEKEFNEFCFILIKDFFIRFYTTSNYDELLPCLTKFVKLMYFSNQYQFIEELDFIESKLNDFSINKGLSVESIFEYYYFSALNFMKFKNYRTSNKYFNILLKLPLNSMSAQNRIKISINFIINYYFLAMSLSQLFSNVNFDLELKNLIQFQNQSVKDVNSSKYRIIDILIKLNELNLPIADAEIQDELSVTNHNYDFYDKSILKDLSINFRILILKQKTQKISKIYLKDLKTMDCAGRNMTVDDFEKFLIEISNSKKWDFEILANEQNNEKYIRVVDAKKIDGNSVDELIQGQFKMLNQIKKLDKLNISVSKTNSSFQIS